MACEHALLIEPIAQVVYTNKRPYCNLFSLLVVAVCLIAIIGFVIHIKTFVSELKTEIANLKDDNQRLANKVEAMNISELRDWLDEVNDDNQRIANKLKAMNIYELKTEVTELKTKFRTHYHKQIRGGLTDNTTPPYTSYPRTGH